MNYLKLAGLFFIFLCLQRNVIGADSAVDFKGYIDTFYAVKEKDSHAKMHSQTRLYGEISKTFGSTALFSAFSLYGDSLTEKKLNASLKELYLDYRNQDWGIKLGKQLIIWGNADSLRITDIITPLDYRNFLAQDYNDNRIAVEALRVFKFYHSARLELVLVPVFRGFKLPLDAKNPWNALASFSPNSMSILINDSKKPKNGLKNADIGGRISFTYPGIDFAFSALYTWNKRPSFELDSINHQVKTMLITPVYHRMGFIGFDMAKPIGDFVFRTEIGFNRHKSFDKKPQYGLGYQLSNSLQWMLGLDWFAVNNWTLSTQIYSELITNHSDKLIDDKNSILGTLAVTKKLLRDTLEIKGFNFIDFKKKSFMTRLSVDYAVNDSWHLLTGYDKFYGSNQGQFGRYKNNSNLWFRIKYSFAF